MVGLRDAERRQRYWQQLRPGTDVDNQILFDSGPALRFTSHTSDQLLAIELEVRSVAAAMAYLWSCPLPPAAELHEGGLGAGHIDIRLVQRT